MPPRSIPLYDRMIETEADRKLRRSSVDSLEAHT